MEPPHEYPKRPLRVGILGTGRIALDHARAVTTLGHVLAAGAATRPDSESWIRFRELAPDAAYFQDGSRLLDAPEVDAVISCLPWNVTERWLPRLLAARKPVLIEKPIALSQGAVMAALKNLEGERSRDKYVGFNRRFYEPVQRLRERVLAGGLLAGEILVSETVRRHAERMGAGILDHLLAYSSAHLLDTAMHVLGDLQLKAAHCPSRNGPFPTRLGILETPEKVPVSYSILAECPVPAGIRLYFSDGTTWHLAPLERLAVYDGYDIREPDAASPIRSYVPRRTLEVQAGTELKPGFLAQMRAFLDGDGREIAATPADSARLLGLIEGIRKA